MATLTPAEALIDRAVRCVICGAPMGGCSCHTKCRCGWTYRAGESCRNPVHEVENAAREHAKVVAASVVARMLTAYPEPMRYASGGFRKTLRGYVEEEVARALIDAAGASPTPEEEQTAADILKSDIARFRASRGAAR